MTQDPEHPDGPPNPQSKLFTGAPDSGSFFSRSLSEHWRVARDFLRETLNLQQDANIQGTVETIKKDMVFRGHVVWVLVCSIFIASIGLDTNSAAVVIGAMLISPLMGPILAVGLSVGTNDIETLRRALKNFLVMVVASLITSTVYFLITPLGEAQSELLARTRPTLLDALVGLFGGIAGIVGVSRRDRGNVIPGVAIATALMPPLCTAGYGLANGEWSYFFGASYLFVLNSIFIAIATVMIVRYLHFPMVQYMDADARRRTRTRIAAFVLVVLLPSFWILGGVVQESLFRQRAGAFIGRSFDLPGVQVVNTRVAYGDTSRIDVFLMGDTLPTLVRARLESDMAAAGIENTVLDIHQPRDLSGELGRLEQEVRVGVVEDLFQRNQELLQQREAQIADLQAALAAATQDTVPMVQLSSEMRVVNPAVRSVSFGQVVEVRGDTVDTIPTFLVGWQRGPTGSQVQQLENWLRIRLGFDTLRVITDRP